MAACRGRETSFSCALSQCPGRDCLGPNPDWNLESEAAGNSAPGREPEEARSAGSAAPEPGPSDHLPVGRWCFGRLGSGLLPGLLWSCGGDGDADAPATAQAQEPGLAPPLMAAALILSSCFHFLVLVHYWCWSIRVLPIPMLGTACFRSGAACLLNTTGNTNSGESSVFLNSAPAKGCGPAGPIEPAQEMRIGTIVRSLDLFYPIQLGTNRLYQLMQKY